MTFGLRIRVDFNRRSGDGSVIASLARATGVISAGDVVIAYQPGEDMEHFARVTSIDESTGRAELDVNWQSDPSDWAPVNGAASVGSIAPLLMPGHSLYSRGSSASRSSGLSVSRVPLDDVSSVPAPSSRERLNA